MYNIPSAARRLIFGVRHGLRPAMAAHCIWSTMMCRMLGGAAAGCALKRPVVAAAVVATRKLRRLIELLLMTDKSPRGSVACDTPGTSCSDPLNAGYSK